MNNSINKNKRKKTFDVFAQFALPGFTIGAQILTSLKYPQFGLIANLMAQPFWLYSTWKGYKQANQIGMFINTVIFATITIFGIINYWFL